MRLPPAGCLLVALLGGSALTQGFQHGERVLAHHQSGLGRFHLLLAHELEIGERRSRTDVGGEEVPLVGGDVGLVGDQDVGEDVHLVLTLLGPHHQVAAALAVLALERRANQHLRHHRRYRDDVCHRDFDGQLGLGVRVAVGHLGGQLIADGEVSELTQLLGVIGKADFVESRGNEVHPHVVDRMRLELQSRAAILLRYQFEVRFQPQQVTLLRNTAIPHHHGREAHHHVFAEGTPVEEHAADIVRVDFADAVGGQLGHQLLGGQVLLAHLDGRRDKLERPVLGGLEDGLTEVGDLLVLERDGVTEDVVVDVVPCLVTEERQVDGDDVLHVEGHLHGMRADRSTSPRNGRQPRTGETAEEDVADMLFTALQSRGVATAFEIAAPVELVRLLEEEGDGPEQLGEFAVAAHLVEAVGVDAQDVDDLGQLLVEHLDGFLHHGMHGRAGVLLADAIDHLRQRLAIARFQLGELAFEAGHDRLVLGRHGGASLVHRVAQAAEARVVEGVELTIDHQRLQTISSFEHDAAVLVGLAGLADRHHLVDLDQLGELAGVDVGGVERLDELFFAAVGRAGGGRVGLGGRLAGALAGRLGALDRSFDDFVDALEREVLATATLDRLGVVTSGGGGSDGVRLALTEVEIEF